MFAFRFFLLTIFLASPLSSYGEPIRSYKKSIKTPKGYIYLKNTTPGEPVIRPSRLDLVYVCENKASKVILKDYPHCALKTDQIRETGNHLTLLFLDMHPQTGECTIERQKRVKIPTCEPLSR